MSQLIPTSKESAFVSSALNAVSRSFALVIPMLEAPLDTSVGVAYLLCRVCDNIEDCTHPYAWKQARFAEFCQILYAPETAQQTLEQWGKYAWLGLREEERALMGPNEGGQLWQLFAKMSPEHIEVIAHWASEMARGMEILQAPAPNPHVRVSKGIHVLQTAKDLDAYCYFVAGTVGHMCTELTARHYGLCNEVLDTLNQHAEAFGRALQKTNIFKDFAEDLARGVSYMPWEWLTQIDGLPLEGAGAPHEWVRMVLMHIWKDLDRAVDYIVALPYSALGYRQFCLRAILPAYETMLLACTMTESLFTPRHTVKISRTRMVQCLEWASQMDQDNAKLLDYRRERAVQRDDLLNAPSSMGRTQAHSNRTTEHFSA